MLELIILEANIRIGRFKSDQIFANLNIATHYQKIPQVVLRDLADSTHGLPKRIVPFSEHDIDEIFEEPL